MARINVLLVIVMALAGTYAHGQQDNLGRLIEGLLFGDGTIGVFAVGDRVEIPMALVSVADVTVTAGGRRYLVQINDLGARRHLAPFYVVSGRRLSLMNLQFPNTVFENLTVEFVGYGEYLENRVPRNTYVFRLLE